ncbi:hypothetical protein HW132_25025 [Brasilonema sp. CT11]|nr:hypothetical protein [Brasilonema sp. CT11]
MIQQSAKSSSKFFQLGITDFSQTDKRVALAKVVQVHAEESIAEITKILRQEQAGNNLRL